MAVTYDKLNGIENGMDDAGTKIDENFSALSDTVKSNVADITTLKAKTNYPKTQWRIPVHVYSGWNIKTDNYATILPTADPDVVLVQISGNLTCGGVGPWSEFDLVYLDNLPLPIVDNSMQHIKTNGNGGQYLYHNGSKNNPIIKIGFSANGIGDGEWLFYEISYFGDPKQIGGIK